MTRLRPRLARVATFLVAVAAIGGCASSAEKADAKTAVAAGDVAVARPAVASAAGGMSGGAPDSTGADRGRIRGSEDARVWLVEISDFQCPYCKRWHDEVSALIEKEYVRTGKVRHAFINFPLTSIHPNARGAAEAAMCASMQGKFWEVHDALFAAQDRWAKLPNPAMLFDSLAVARGVDAAAWRACVKHHVTLPLVDADHDRWAAVGVSSTPTFFIGNRGLVGGYPIDTFRVVIDAELAKARGGR